MSVDLKYGSVTAWDPKTARIRVRLHENGLVSYWLQVPQGYSQTTQRRCPVEIGTEVAILLQQDGVNGILLGALYSLANPPPLEDNDTDYIRYHDGSVIEYQPATGVMNIQLTQAGSIHLTAPSGVILHAANGVTINAPAGGVKISGNVTISDGDLSVEGISFLKHTHSGVRGGPDSSGKPQ